MTAMAGRSPKAVSALPFYWDTNPGMIRQAAHALAQVLADSSLNHRLQSLILGLRRHVELAGMHAFQECVPFCGCELQYDSVLTLRVSNEDGAAVAKGYFNATTTRRGLRVRAELDRGSYPTGVKVADAELAAVPLSPP
jgi:hypothetical protein